MRITILLNVLLIISTSLFGQNKDCRCFNGIVSSENDRPSFTVEFSNGEQISVCGYEEKKISDNKMLLSEFEVFNCKTGEILIQYKGYQYCQVSKENGILVITGLKYLPAGDNWEWIQVPIGIEKVIEKEDKIIATGQKPKFENVKIEAELIDKFYKELEKIKTIGKIENPEEILGKLEILALNKEQKATIILFDFENYFNYLTDGAIAEQWKAAIATVEWINE